jgi:hypothetical protein
MTAMGRLLKSTTWAGMRHWEVELVQQHIQPTNITTGVRQRIAILQPVQATQLRLLLPLQPPLLGPNPLALQVQQTLLLILYTVRIIIWEEMQTSAQVRVQVPPALESSG